MKLLELLKGIDPISIDVLGAKRKAQSAKRNNNDEDDTILMDMDITSIHYRAQEVQPGGMFVALKGQTADGHDFMHQAFENRAAAVVSQKEPPQPYLSVSRYERRKLSRYLSG